MYITGWNVRRQAGITLHITYISPQYVLQFSDRLVTLRSRGGLRPLDPEANKTVIYVARDAFLSIGYTGVAYLDNRPTDQWIAEKLIGSEVGPRTRVQGTGAIPQRLTTGPTGPWYDAGSAIRVLCEGLIATRGLRTVERHNFPRLIVAGWQRWKRHSRPVAYVIADDGVEHLYCRLTVTPRHDWLRGRFYLNFTPINSQLANIRAELTKQLEDSSPTANELEQRMAQALRRAADQYAKIGKYYLAVLLPPPAQRRIRTRYAPFDAPTQRVGQPDQDVSPYHGPVGFTPWIITPHYEAGPSVFVNSQDYS